MISEGTKTHKSLRWQYATALTVFVTVSLVSLWLQKWIGYQAVALVYLLAVVLLALFVGRGPTLFGTILTALGWIFFFAPPVFAFHISNFYDSMMVVMYFVVTLIVGHLTTHLRAQRGADKEREQKALALYLLARELAGSADHTDLLKKVVRQLGTVFNADIFLLLPDSTDYSRLTTCMESTWQPNEHDRAIATWAFEHNQRAGRGTETFTRDAEGFHIPLSSGDLPAGVAGLRVREGADLTPQQRDLLEKFVREIALVLEHQRLREISNRLLTESERLGRTLLNSVSHELRTPIAVITSAASGLRSAGPLNSGQQDLATEIESASARLNRVVQSLLSAARLQSGQVRPNLDWCDVRDVAREALQETAVLLENHQVEMKIATDLPLAKMDFVLMEQALANLLANAAIHTPPKTQVEISARIAGAELILEVSDRGPGVPPDHLERVFDSFHRAPDSKPGGTGLGLAIVKGFVEAQNGRVQADHRPGGGTTFRIFIPASEAPDMPEEIS
jgi:two-component system sensor histidine kinase KdpD